jgi:hypothetical protein
VNNMSNSGIRWLFSTPLRVAGTLLGIWSILIFLSRRLFEYPSADWLMVTVTLWTLWCLWWVLAAIGRHWRERRKQRHGERDAATENLQAATERERSSRPDAP